MIPNGPLPVLVSPDEWGHPLSHVPAQPVDLMGELHKALAVQAYMHQQGQQAAQQPVLTPLHMAADRLPPTLGHHVPVFPAPFSNDFNWTPTPRGPR